jgi:hypothetical protein
MTIGDEGLPAELRVPPTTEPAVEVGEGVRLPPEAAVVAVTHDEGAASPGDSGTTISYEALAAAEAAGEHAHRLPAEMRVPPTTEPTVEVGEGVRLPPEVAVVAVTEHGPRTDPSTA